MAKENKTAAQAAEITPAVKNENNIREQLDAASLGRKELADAALAKLKKDHDERTQNEMAKRFQKAQYKVEAGLLKLRRERDIADIQKKELVYTDRLARHLMGFTVTEEIIKQAAGAEDIISEEKNKEVVDVKAKTIKIGDKTYKVGNEVPPVIDYVDYDNLANKIPTEVRKQINEIEKVHSTYVDKLDAKYNQYWDHSWRW